jgi:hypothetical protein
MPIDKAEKIIKRKIASGFHGLIKLNPKDWKNPQEKDCGGFYGLIKLDPKDLVGQWHLQENHSNA